MANHRAQPDKQPHPVEPHKHGKHPGKGGSRQGFKSSNEIEDMEIFDAEPEKAPSADHRHSAKSIDDNQYRKRK